MSLTFSPSFAQHQIVRLSSLTEGAEGSDNVRFLRTREALGLEAAHSRLQEAEEVIRTLEDRIHHLEGLALTDELTGLINRRGFNMALKRETTVARRDRRAGGLLVLIDLDGFKAVNDTYGHQVGDLYLHTVGKVLSESVRSTDYVARLGGDEFAILMPRVTPRVAMERFTRIEKNFIRKVMYWKNETLPLRASFGGALYDGSETADDVFAEADGKLYAQKAKRKE